MTKLLVGNLEFVLADGGRFVSNIPGANFILDLDRCCDDWGAECALVGGVSYTSEGKTPEEAVCKLIVSMQNTVHGLSEAILHLKGVK
jgi:hypothetical protein